MINLITGAELAELLCFTGMTSACRKFLQDLGIRPVPGRKDCYDPVAVRHRLNHAQGIHDGMASAKSSLEVSRGRRHAA
jgi:hypothetical protein